MNLSELCKRDPVVAYRDTPLPEAARLMRERHVGSLVIVLERLGQRFPVGILTDRDIVVRAVAEGRDLAGTKVADICSQELTTLSPTDSVEDAVRLMRDKAIRRLPVVEGGKPVGIVSIGDLAVSQDPHSALGHISAAPANR
jgi:CBS domain-containing protein